MRRWRSASSEEKDARRSTGMTPTGVPCSWNDWGGRATLTEPAVLARPLGDLPATYVKCTLGDPEPSDGVAKLLTSGRWRLIELDTGHWPMFSRPRELAQVLLDMAGA